MSVFRIDQGDVLEVLKGYPDNHFHGLLCDPPYGLNFMGKKWDYSVPKKEVWAECLRVLRPGASLMAFGGSRTFHRLAVEIEDAGFGLRDTLMWLYGQGFPKSMSVGCRCKDGESAAQRDVRSVSGSDVPAAVHAGDERREVLLQGVPEHGAPSGGSVSAARQHGAGERVLEGRNHLQAEQGELHRPAVRPMPGGVPSNGQGGRVRDGSPAGHGAGVGADAGPRGGGASSGSRHAEQRAGESGTLPGQRVAQAGGGVGTACEVCGGLIGWGEMGSALKPAHEPIILARKPLEGTVAANVAKWGVGGLAIDASRIEATDKTPAPVGQYGGTSVAHGAYAGHRDGSSDHLGRWPANVLLDSEAGEVLDAQSGERPGNSNKNLFAREDTGHIYGNFAERSMGGMGRNDSGGASRFFKSVEHDSRFMYCAKASRKERDLGCGEGGNNHSCVKPIDLIRYLARLILPPTEGATLLVPFSGSGSEMIGAMLAGWQNVQGIEREAEYITIAHARIPAHVKDAA